VLVTLSSFSFRERGKVAEAIKNKFMQFRGSPTSTDATYQQGIVEEIDRLCSSDDTSYPRPQKTLRVNNALEKVIGYLINADGIWEFDDSNYTSLPIGVYTLVNAQRSYTFAADFLDILEVAVLNSNSVYKKIDQFDPFIETATVEEIYGTVTGFPVVYDLVSDDTIKFYPNITSTQVTLTDGLRVKFKRTGSLFTVTTGTGEDTKVPGFASPWHIILAYMASIPFCIEFYPERVPGYKVEIKELLEELIKHYSRRNKDVRNVMTMQHTNYI